jgi:hypothetical protein
MAVAAISDEAFAAPEPAAASSDRSATECSRYPSHFATSVR